MPYTLQKEIQHELDTRIPRGPTDSWQNYFRSGFSFFRSQHLSFDERIARAAAGIAERVRGRSLATAHCLLLTAYRLLPTLTNLAARFRMACLAVPASLVARALRVVVGL